MMITETADSLSRSAQDYLKAIYSLTRDGGPIGTLELAETLQVKPASVSNMLQKLDVHQPRLVDYQKHRGVSLTHEGEQVALKVIRRHRLLEQFLFQILHYPWNEVHNEAEVLEHVISPLMEDRIAELLGEPQYDPHGEPIPSRALEVVDHPQIISLCELEQGQSGLVRQVDSHRDDLLAYFTTIGLKPGKLIRVLQRNPLDGAQRIGLEDRSEEHIISPLIARAIHVSRI